ncbi:hypothetical protein S40293_10484 [Stachybotrys chartarum IBT 40293]|nr:hypothetical protein S40293_10484 [Stachybotrys chartarum IBT 40293]
MATAPVRKVPFPGESRLQPLYKSAYFIDAFAVTLPRQQATTYKPHAVARAFFDNPPAWCSLLMWIRDHIMSMFGVKGSTQIQAEAVKRGMDTVSVFPVISSTDKEIILGEDDSHLNFSISIMIRDVEQPTSTVKEDDEKETELVSTTVVHCHGWLGRAYLAVIGPFHVFIVKYNLARLPGKIMKQ